jgi:hypothetical protein
MGRIPIVVRTARGGRNVATVDITAAAEQARYRLEDLRDDGEFAGGGEQSGVAVYVAVSELLDDLSDEEVAAIVAEGLVDSDPSVVKEQRRELRSVARGLLLSRVAVV